MDSDALSIGELADAVGLTRRAIRFYVQQKLIPPPNGRGRGDHYDGRHLAHLRRVLELQQAGHSLDAIRKLLASDPPGREPKGSAPGPDAAPAPLADGRASAPESPPPPAALRASLWTRLSLGEGIELSFDAARFNPTVEQLLRLRQMIRDELL
ncbi:MAG TPA: helix-turn-helix domain-containing protein [Humisphaera sp.]